MEYFIGDEEGGEIDCSASTCILSQKSTKNQMDITDEFLDLLPTLSDRINGDTGSKSIKDSYHEDAFNLVRCEHFLYIIIL